MKNLFDIIKPVCFQRKVLDADFIVKHRHPSVEIVYVTSGAIHIDIDHNDGRKSELYVYPHEFTIIEPNTYHVLKSAVADTSILEIELLHANAKLSILDYLYSIKILSDSKPFCNILSSVANGNKFYDSIGIDKILQRIILLLNDRSENNANSMFELDYTVGLEELLVQICHCKSLPEHSKDNLHINRIITFIKNNYEKDLSIDVIANMLSLSKSYIQALFKQEMGIGIMQYTNKIRLEHALELMSDGSRNLHQIATLCGFKTYRNFYNNFVSKYDILPTKWLESKPKEIFNTTP